MDTLTHALAGAVVSDACFRRKLGPIATPFALIVAASPDVDIITYFISPQSAWANHRGYTHAFFLMLLAASVIGWIGWRLSGRQGGGWTRWAFLALLCLCSHTIIDLVTSWGTMPWLPFSRSRESWDIAPILDVFTFSVTATSFLANRLLRFERVDTFLNPLAFSVVHRHPGRQKAADWTARIALGLLVCYLLVGWRQNRQVVDLARRELAATGVRAEEVRALPLMFTYIAWGIVARDAEGTLYNAVYSTYAPKPMRFVRFPSDRGPEVERALATPEGKMFAWYSQGMYAARLETVERDGVTRREVHLCDRRFFALSHSYQPRFCMFYAEDENGKALPVRFKQLSFRDIDRGEELRRLRQITFDGEVHNPDAPEMP